MAARPPQDDVGEVTKPPALAVQLSFSALPTGGKRRVQLATKVKKKGLKTGAKKKGKATPQAGRTPQTGKHKKKRRKGKKKHPSIVDDLEVTTNTDDILEDPEDFDDLYKKLKKQVLAKLGDSIEITHCAEEETLEEKICHILATDCDTFYLVDLSTIILKYRNWIQAMPRVRPFYAMKCNPDQRIVNTLVACGAGCDVASMPEMQKGLDAGLDPESMIFANPCKMREHIKFAREHGVAKMTFDNADELRKIHSVYPEAHLVLRILADDSHSTMRFGSKFGAKIDSEVEPLLKLAYSLDLKVIGVSFHVGSGCQSGEAYRNSLLLARKVFDMAAGFGHPMTFLDIGGGFLGSDTKEVVFDDVAASIIKSLDELFPDTTIIAEPGRYFASECVVLVTTVIARRERIHQEEGQEPETYVDYYISDGVYGSFNNMFFDYYRPNPHALGRLAGPEQSDLSSNSSVNLASGAETPEPSRRGLAPPGVLNAAPGTPVRVAENPQHHSTLFGPTCDSIDVVCKDVELPELEIGDHVYFFNMGAYTSAAASSFNGFVPPKSYFIIS